MRIDDKVIRKWVRIVLLVLMLATLVYIFSNSMVPAEESAAQSDTVRDTADKIIPDSVPAKPTILDNIRKLAHFVEFGILGIEVAIYVVFYEKKRLYISLPVSYAVPFIFGFVDESIQVLSSRGPEITDVWIDALGFATFASVVYLVFGAVMLTLFAVRRIKKKGKKNEKGQE